MTRLDFKKTYHPFLDPAVGVVLQEIEVATSGDHRAGPDFFYVWHKHRHVQVDGLDR